MLALEVNASSAPRRALVHHYLKLSQVQEHAARKWAPHFGNDLEKARMFVADFAKSRGKPSVRPQSVGALQDLKLGAFWNRPPSDKFLSIGRLNEVAQSQPRFELPNGARAQARAQWAALGFSEDVVSRIMNKDYSPIREVRIFGQRVRAPFYSPSSLSHLSPFLTESSARIGHLRPTIPFVGSANFLAAEQKPGQVDGWKSEKGNVRFETHPAFGSVAIKDNVRQREMNNAKIASDLRIGPKVMEASNGRIVMERVKGETLEDIMEKPDYKVGYEKVYPKSAAPQVFNGIRLQSPPHRVDSQFGDKTLEKVVNVLRYSNPQVADRLAKIHDQVVSHKRKGESNGLQVSDLNTSNIMVTPEGRVVLLDFEI